MPQRDPAPPGAPCWIELSSSAPDRVERYYRELFGWDVDPAQHGSAARTFTLNGRPVGGLGSTPPGAPDGWMVYLGSRDTLATFEAALDAGAAEVRAPQAPGPEGTAVISTPGGAQVGIWQLGGQTVVAAREEAGAPLWFELETRRFSDALDFYRDVFHWESLEVLDGYARFSAAGRPLAGIVDAAGYLSAGAPSRWLVYFGVTDVDAAAADAERLGGTVIDPPRDTPVRRVATITDPTGSPLKIASLL